MSDDPDAAQLWLAPRARKLVPYAGADQQHRRMLARAPAQVLQEIMLLQRRGMLLSEIGDAIGSREIVRVSVIGWLWRIGEDGAADRA